MFAEVYRTKVAVLKEAITTSPDSAAGDQPEIILTGALAAMLKLTMPETAALAASGHDLFLSSAKVVAGARNRLDLLLIGQNIRLQT